MEFSRNVLSVKKIAGLLMGAAVLSAPAAVWSQPFQGNICQRATWSVNSRRAEGCVARISSVKGQRGILQFAVGAFDHQSDGYSARVELLVYQYGKQTGWSMSPPQIVLASGGANTSQLGPRFFVQRQAGKTHVYLHMTVCGYDTPTRKVYDCYSHQVLPHTYESWD